MKKTLSAICMSLMLQGIAIDPAWSSHDNGQGKSQDCPDPTSCVAMAPEPSTYWSFLLGLTALALWTRSRRRHQAVGSPHA